MNRAGWILLFVLFAVCAYATLQKEHMTTAGGYTLGPSTIVDNTAYADTVADELGQMIRRNMPTSTARGRDMAVPPVCPTGSTFVKARGTCVDGQNKNSSVPCPEGYGFIRSSGNCELVAPEPAARSARMSGSGNTAPPPSDPVSTTCSEYHDKFTTAAINMDAVPIFSRGTPVPPGCKPPSWFPDMSDRETIGTLIEVRDGVERFNAAASARAYTSSRLAALADEPLFPNPPPQCPPRRQFMPGKGCVGSNGKSSQPMCFDGAPYIPDPLGLTIGTCGPVPEPKRATQDRAPPSEGPPAGYTEEGTPAQVAPAALTGLQVGGPNDGGIGKSSGGSGNASWGGDGTKYPNLLGPNNKKSNLPDNNMTANLVLPTPCQVGVDGNTLYSPGCRAPTDLGYFTLPTIPKTDGDPSPFSGDYTVFMK